MSSPIRLALSLALLLGLGWGLPGASAAAALHPEARVQTAGDDRIDPESSRGDSSLPAPSPQHPAEDAIRDDLQGPLDLPPKKPHPEASPYVQKKTDLLAHRRRSRAPGDHNEAPVSEPDETDADGLPPHKGAEEMLVGGMLMVISGVLKMQNIRGQAGMFLIIVFAIVGVMCAVLGAVQQILSYRKRKKWIQNQGSLLDHLKD